jgi:F0F1-type ATP synthase epsilon subunit
MADDTVQPEKSEAEQVAKSPTGKPVMAVKVYAPFKVYFEGDAYSVSAVNDVGPFDILPKHHNFLCMLVPCNLVVETPKGQQTIKIHRALMHVKADRVVVFVDV